MAALRTPNCDYAARPGDALRTAVAWFRATIPPSGRCPRGPGVAATAAGRRHLRITCMPRVRGGPCPPRRRTAGAGDDDLRSHGSRPGRRAQLVGTTARLAQAP